MRRLLYILAVALLLMPYVVHPGIAEEQATVSADLPSPLPGTGRIYGVSFKGIDAGVIYGDTNGSNGVYLYVRGLRATGTRDLWDGDRLLDRAENSSYETLFFGVYRIVEFRDSNNNSRLDGESRGYDYHLTGQDTPIRGFDLNSTWDVEKNVVEGKDYTLLEISLYKWRPKANIRWNEFSGSMEPVNGSVLAESVSFNFSINISCRADTGDLYRYNWDESNITGKETVSGEAVSIRMEMSYSIERWRFVAQESRVLVQFLTGIYGGEEGPAALFGGHHINITSTSPKHLEIYSNTEIETAIDMHGREQRIFLGEKKIADIRGIPYAISDGKNETYVQRLMGRGSRQMPHPAGKGFSIISSSAYGQANTTNCSWNLETEYFLPYMEERTDATPGRTVYALLMEAGAISAVAVFVSYRRYTRRS